MNPDRLFLHKCDRLARLLQSRVEAEHLDIAGIIRQLLLDKHSLVDTVNRSGLTIEFEIGSLPPLDRSETGEVWMQVLADAIDPYHRSGERKPNLVTITRNAFARHPIAELKGEKITIKDVVKYAANIAGGVHHDPRTTHDYKVVEALSELSTIEGMPSTTKQLNPLARVVMRGLRPLVAEVRSRLA